MTALAEAISDTQSPAGGEFVSFPDSPFQLLQPFAPAGDQPTADVLTQRLDVHEKTAWMLRSLLED